MIPTIAGLAIGLLRYSTNYPSDLPGFFKEINDAHVDPSHTPVTVAISAMSLACGASLGPEQALGNFSGGLGTLVSERMNLENDNEKRVIVLSAMASALGCLFPNPLLGVQMIMECADKLPK